MHYTTAVQKPVTSPTLPVKALPSPRAGFGITYKAPNGSEFEKLIAYIPRYFNAPEEEFTINTDQKTLNVEDQVITGFYNSYPAENVKEYHRKGFEQWLNQHRITVSH